MPSDGSINKARTIVGISVASAAMIRLFPTSSSGRNGVARILRQYCLLRSKEIASLIRFDTTVETKPHKGNVKQSAAKPHIIPADADPGLLIARPIKISSDALHTPL